MSPRTITALIVLFFVATGVLFFLNFMEIYAVKADEKYIAFNDIRGMAIFHSDKPYTLNFEQQTESVRYLNEAKTVDKMEISPNTSPLNISRIVIYRFGKQMDIDITPIAYLNDELVFSAPLWEKEKYLKENSRGKLKKLLSQTYDP